MKRAGYENRDIGILKKAAMKSLRKQLDNYAYGSGDKFRQTS